MAGHAAGRVPAGRHRTLAHSGELGSRAKEFTAPALDAQTALLRRLQRDHGARLLVLSDSAAARRLDESLPVPTGVPGWLGPMIEILPAQLYTYHLTRARGLDPEKPRTITKVTRTR